MDYKQARFNMIEQQVRTWKVLDKKVLNMLSLTHRENYVPTSYKKLAYSDINIPLAHGQITMQPKMEARLIQELNINKQDKILEIGSGCGYLTAILSRFGKEVITLDIFNRFTLEVEDKLAKDGIKNAHLITADGVNGWPALAPYDVIVLTGSLARESETIEKQLKIGGRLFSIIGKHPIMEAFLVTKVANNQWHRESLFETYVPPLIGEQVINNFQF